jgi:hypothetical protein
MCPGESQVRYAGFRGLRGKRRTIRSECRALSGDGPCPLKQVRPTPTHPSDLEIAMSRIMLICSLAALLAAGSTQSASAVESANQTLGRKRVWPAPMWVSPRGAAPSVNVSPISTTPCGTRRTSLNADRGGRPEHRVGTLCLRNQMWPDARAQRRGSENIALNGRDVPVSLMLSCCLLWDPQAGKRRARFALRVAALAARAAVGCRGDRSRERAIRRRRGVAA